MFVKSLKNCLLVKYVMKLLFVNFSRARVISKTLL